MPSTGRMIVLFVVAALFLLPAKGRHVLTLGKRMSITNNVSKWLLYNLTVWRHLQHLSGFVSWELTRSINVLFSGAIFSNVNSTDERVFKFAISSVNKQGFLSNITLNYSVKYAAPDNSFENIYSGKYIYHQRTKTTLLKLLKNAFTDYRPRTCTSKL